MYGVALNGLKYRIFVYRSVCEKRATYYDAVTTVKYFVNMLSFNCNELMLFFFVASS